MKLSQLTLLGLLALSSCSAAGDTKAAEAAVVQFHSDLNGARFDKIYSETAPEFKSASTRPDFTKLLEAVHRKLGSFRSGKTIGWNDNVNTSGHFVILNRQAQFEKGPAEEQFIFKLNGTNSVIVGYHIASNTLITS
ncbi:MAG: DUF3887 domain-containing protein [Sphingomicrobium sp.]